jgi:hypothetical protein
MLQGLESPEEKKLSIDGTTDDAPESFEDDGCNLCSGQDLDEAETGVARHPFFELP